MKGVKELTNKLRHELPFVIQEKSISSNCSCQWCIIGRRVEAIIQEIEDYAKVYLTSEGKH